jgi:serine/threonine-protein phosphatase 5
MAIDEERALELKNEGNKAFAAHDWPKAIDFYTKAIEANPNEPTFYANRAQVRKDRLPTLTCLCLFPMRCALANYSCHRPQANIKCEAYGYAISDATKAIELKPDFVKVSHPPSQPTLATANFTVAFP